MNKGKVLIVEDEFLVAANLQAEVESLGYTVAGLASSGEQALAIARREHPDLALMDIKIRGTLDGIDTATRMRRESNVPVVFLTAFADDRVVERAKPSEPLGYLVKPFHKKELRATIETACYKARMERRLKESETRFRSLFEYAPVAYVALNESGCCVDANDQLHRLVGLTPEEVAGRSFGDLWPPAARHRFPAHFTRFCEAGEVREELLLTHADGTHVTVAVEGRIQRDLDGRFIRAHCVLHDLTARKAAEEERMRLARQLQQVHKADSLARMAGAVSHHYNNLLSVIIGNLEMAMVPGTTDATGYLAAAKASACRAAGLGRSMLAYLGQTIGECKAVDLAALCRQCLQHPDAVLPDNITISTELPAHGPVVTANGDQIAKVIDHLVVNAREAIDDRAGHIAVSLGTVVPDRIPSAHRCPADWQPTEAAYACLEIADTGCGIAPEALENLFDPFFSTKFTGRGLGLAVSAGTLKQHNGALTVASIIGKGTTFRVYLPLSGPPAIEPEQSGRGRRPD